MRILMILIILDISLALAVAPTGPYMLVLVTLTEHFETQLVTFKTLKACTNAGAKLMVDQELYLGFGCVLEDRLPQ